MAQILMDLALTNQLHGTGKLQKNVNFFAKIQLDVKLLHGWILAHQFGQKTENDAASSINDHAQNMGQI